MSDPKTTPPDSCCGASCDPLTDAQRIEILCQQVEGYRRAEHEAIDARDAALSRVEGLKSQLDDADLAIEAMGQESGDAPMNTALRDVVRGQVLALLSAESREAVRCATNALGDALDKTAPPSKDDDETTEDRIAALLDNPVTQTMIQKGLEYFCPAPPPAPTPNLTVTGPMGSVVFVFVTDEAGRKKQINCRIVGKSGVVKMVAPNHPVEVVTRLDPHGDGVSVFLDFTEESHELDAVMMADSLRRSKEAKASPQPIVTPPPAAKKRAPKRKA